LAGEDIWARVIEMHDSDSLKVVLEVNGKLYKTMTRLVGIDAPEIRSKDPKERELAVRSRDRAAQWVLGGSVSVGGMYTEKELRDRLWGIPVIVLLRCQHMDKYGRLLCTVFRDSDDKISLNDVLVQEGYADLYDGGHKLRTWDTSEGETPFFES
jgi:endonuclease YncB( thermonuclease family)